MVARPALPDRPLTLGGGSPGDGASTRSPRRRVLVEWVVVAIVAALMVAVSVSQGFTTSADNLVYDALLKLDRHAPSDNIVIVAIDNRSLRELGRWPWPRRLHTELLGQLAKARPAVIGYDVLLVEPAPDPRDDQALAAAIKSAAPTVLPLLLEPGDGAAWRVSTPTAPIAAAAAGIGNANLQFDTDGVVRRTALSESDGARLWPHMMTQVRDLAARGAPPPKVASTRTESATRLIPFDGPPGTFRTVSFVDALRGETPPDVFRGKTVLVGATADGLFDRYPTPVSSGTELLSGIELQADILDALQSGRLIRPLSTPWIIALSLAPLMVLMAGFLALRPKQNMLLGVGLALAPPAASALLLLSVGVWFPPTAAIAGLVLVYPLWSWRRLSAASAFILQELSALRREPDLLRTSSRGAPKPALGGDAIDRQVFLLHEAVRNLRDLRLFMSDALQSLPDATLVVGAGGAVMLANEAAAALFRQETGRDPVGHDFGALLATIALHHPQARADETAPIWVADRQEFHTRDGAVFELRSTDFQDSAGEFTGWIVRLSDVTAMKTAARQREQVLQLLSHDMRSPQVSILALLGAAGADEPIVPDHARRIDHYARRTLALADNFVSLARAEQPHYAIEVINLADVLVEAVDSLWPQLQAKSMRVSTEGCEDDYPVAGDRTLLLRAFVNLIDNALKFSNPGDSVECELSRLSGPPSAVCTIRDHGRGMSAETLAGLFQPFHRGGDGDPVEGIGLGLTFVRTVVLRHQGQISCDSAVGAGAMFRVQLPLADGAGASDDEPAQI